MLWFVENCKKRHCSECDQGYVRYNMYLMSSASVQSQMSVSVNVRCTAPGGGLRGAAGSGRWETCIRRWSTLSSEVTINVVTDWTSGHSVPCKSSLNVKSCHPAPMPQHWYYVVTDRWTLLQYGTALWSAEVPPVSCASCRAEERIHFTFSLCQPTQPCPCSPAARQQLVRHTRHWIEFRNSWFLFASILWWILYIYT